VSIISAKYIFEPTILLKTGFFIAYKQSLAISEAVDLFKSFAKPKFH